jgi:enamine deaminase RidA (YjgF/YER057c/UK114 family)
LFRFRAFVLIDPSFEIESCMEEELVIQPGASDATAPARNLRPTRKPPRAEKRLKELGIQLPSPPRPFGSYAEAVRSGNLLFLSGMLPTEGHTAKFVGRAGAEFDVETGRQAARLAALNGLTVAREYLGSLDKIKRIVRLGVSLATTEDCREHPKIADGASDLLQDIFGKDRNPSRLISGVVSLPLGTPVALELIFEVA